MNTKEFMDLAEAYAEGLSEGLGDNEELTWNYIRDALPDKSENYMGFLVAVADSEGSDVMFEVFVDGKFGKWDGIILREDKCAYAWMRIPEPPEFKKEDMW